jgi:DNA-binding CsgD family transcriptional regulator
MGLEKQVLGVVGDVMGLLELEELCAGLMATLRRAIPSDYSAINEVPADLPRTVSLTDPPVPIEYHETFARLALQNPIAAHFMSSRDGRATRFSDLISAHELHALEIYAELYHPLGVEHQIAFSLPSPSERVLGVTLSRSRRDFSDRERDVLNLARPYLIQAYRNALAHSLPEFRSTPSLAATRLEALGLTPRQAEVVRLVAMGHSDQDTAEALGISARTAQKHLERAYRTLGVESRSQAAQLAWTTAVPSSD